MKKFNPDPVLQCGACGYERSVPKCCSQTMKEQNGEIVCKICGRKQKMPEHCGEVMDLEYET